MRQVFTTEEKMGRWEDLREIKNLMGRLSTGYVLKQQREMFRTYWSTREDVCLGINEGWFTGRTHVARYYDVQAERIALESRLIQQAFPEELGGKTPEEVYGVGMMDYKPVDTPVVEIAGDGQTAKGIWCLRGSHSVLTPGGPQAFWEWGWFAADFILEEGDWKLWHLLYLQEVLRPCGSKWTGPAPAYPERPEFAAVRDFQPARPNVPAVLRERYHAARTFVSSPRLPEPYQTFSETFSYGWEGDAP